MDYPTLAIIMLFVGLALIVIEIFIPSGGLIMIMALIAFSASIWCAKKAWWDSNPLMWWSYIAAMLVLLPISIGTAFYLLPRTSLGRRMLLEGPSPDEVTAFADESNRLQQMVGKPGKTLTLLNPGGLVLVGGERMHCESEGMVMLEPNEDIIITGVKGNRLVIRAVRESDQIDEPYEAETDTAGEQPLDFDVPQS